ncbi:helix-turn-helix domain-containing protein [Massilia sp. TS11]|uniref:helix-turn-helix domain-containing protein n=1 Tax=Massilia sp. TS11 TaxID=2908003 RepID=UPI001EDC3E41|nr:helix-turn-helix domain-containing protein [Massilia sp. TS11]MCG2583913.1 helix-turn-helix domain-containing protein [Massilia sp. TS11]
MSDENEQAFTGTGAVVGAGAGASQLPRRRAMDGQGIDALTAEDVALELGCEPQHVKALAASHDLPAVKYGRSWRFPVGALNIFLNEQALAHVRAKPAPSLPTAVGDPKTGRPDLTRVVKVS